MLFQKYSQTLNLPIILQLHSRQILCHYFCPKFVGFDNLYNDGYSLRAKERLSDHPHYFDRDK
nr:MAG TPA: hypothetical protein [Caudoviricetes sp.]